MWRFRHCTPAAQVFSDASGLRPTGTGVRAAQGYLRTDEKAFHLGKNILGGVALALASVTGADSPLQSRSAARAQAW